MIKKAQLKFICIIMSILLIIFSIILFASFLILKKANEQNIEKVLDEIEIGFMFNNEVTIQNSFVAHAIKNNGQEGFVIKYYASHNSTISDQMMISLTHTALAENYKYSSVDNIYYKVNYDGERFLIIASDVTQYLKIFDSNVSNAAIFITTSYLIVFAIVFLLSFSVFEPIKAAFFKQRQFVSNASHELKTPLTIISANAEVIKQNASSPWIDNITFQTERLGLLVDDMLSLAKMDEEREVLNFVKFNLSEVILNVSLSFDAVAFEKGKSLNLFVQPNIQYKGDIKSVKNIVNILLDNAIKHTDIAGEINLYLKKENNKIILSVVNSGSNILDSESNKIFERFFRSEASRSRDSGGSGLGLSIAKSIADNNKWKISACSKYRERMTIIVIF